ncbi:MAG TPA: transglutaminase domain-containing protein [Polyangia bacterium]|nr:transglutaminase domain-containing protein [Polyangia bacterium]
MLPVWALLVMQATPPVLHEFVETGSARAGAPRPVPVMEGQAGAGQLPSEVHQDKEDVRPPGRAAHAPDRDTSFRPDRATAMQATGGYEEPFSPSVAPFARLSALDGVRADYELYLRDSPLEPVPEAAAGTPDRTMFYGRVDVTFRHDTLIALPSPAPDLRIFGYQLERPGGTRAAQAAVEFLRDGADNLYARAHFDGRRVLTFLVDAPRSYFEGSLPTATHLGDVPKSRTPSLPEHVRKAAEPMLARLGLERRLPLDALLDRMVSYFRSFENVDTPANTPSSGDIYVDLTVGQRGVCRHRAFAFVVTAQALGLPARFVSNDVHAFAEVHVPHLGWRRVDLGGAPLDLPRRMSEESRTRPRAPADDPFPQPEKYKSGSASSAVTATAATTAPEPEEGASAPPVGTVAAPDPRASTHVEIDELEGKHARRGEVVDVTGRVAAEGTDAGGLTVDVYLRPLGSSRLEWLASAVTGADGRFRARGAVPRSVPGADHKVIVRVRGDDRRAPSR